MDSDVDWVLIGFGSALDRTLIGSRLVAVWLRIVFASSTLVRLGFFLALFRFRFGSRFFWNVLRFGLSLVCGWLQLGWFDVICIIQALRAFRRAYVLACMIFL